MALPSLDKEGLGVVGQANDQGWWNEIMIGVVGQDKRYFSRREFRLIAKGHNILTKIPMG